MFNFRQNLNALNNIIFISSFHEGNLLANRYEVDLSHFDLKAPLIVLNLYPIKYLRVWHYQTLERFAFKNNNKYFDLV